MGILDSKKRVVDIVMTPLGRESLARDGLRVAYASFTDGQTYYDPSSITGSYDTATDRVYLESPGSLPQDVLALVTDDAGDLIPATAFGSNNDTGVKISKNGTIYVNYEGSNPVAGTNPSGDFSSAVSDIANMFQKSFSMNTIIGTKDPIDDETDFIINPTEASFQFTEDGVDLPVASVNRADSIFFDRRFANLPQFKFLPPVSETAGQISEIGVFSNIKSFNDYTYQDIQNETLGTEDSPLKQRADIEISNTTIQNDIVMQMYEVNVDGVTKLDAVDYGSVIDTSDKQRPLKRIVFYGKVFLDDSETVTYVNLFTVVID